MADEPIEDVNEKLEDDAFNEGFSTPAATLVVPPKADEPVVAAPDVTVVVKEEPVAPPAAAAPEYAQITKEQLATFEAAVARLGDFDKRLDKASGTIGGVQDLVKQLQAATPKGEAIVLTDDMFAELVEDYPDLTVKFRGVLEKVLKSTRGTGTAEPAVIDPNAVNKAVADGIRQREMEALADEYPDWQTIVGAAPSKDKADPNNPFRKWLGTKPVEYQTKINSTHNASTLMKAIADFKDATKAPPPPPTKEPTPKQAARKAVIAAAIPPKGDGNPPAPPKSDDDMFEEGFRGRPS